MADIKVPCIPDDEPHQTLSEYNLFEGRIGNLDPKPGILPYDLNTQLYSDYALKLRMVYLPEDSSAGYRKSGVLAFPVGTVLIKNFYYELDERDPAAGRRILETRLLIHQEQGWRAETYVWNEKQNEAALKQTGDRKQVAWNDHLGNSRKVDYLIPTKNDCKTCHSLGNRLLPLGPKAGNLNKRYPYETGPANQLVKWEQSGILRDIPAANAIPRVPVWDDPSTGALDERARIYLDVNCGSCHNAAGSASNAGLFMTYDQQDLFRMGLCKTPVSAGRGSGGLRYDITPCRPDESIVIYRMRSNEPAVRMPEIGRTLVHEEGVALIKEWIDSLACTACGNLD